MSTIGNLGGWGMTVLLLLITKGQAQGIEKAEFHIKGMWRLMK